MILNFWTKLTQKGYFQSKKEKKKNNLILHIGTSLSSKFQQINLIFWKKFPEKRLLPDKTEKK